MSLKYSQTTSDYLEWKEAMNLIRTLYRMANFKCLCSFQSVVFD